MSHRSMGQLSLADQLVRRQAGQNAALPRLAAVMKWGPIERALGSVYNSSEDRPGQSKRGGGDRSSRPRFDCPEKKACFLAARRPTP